MYGSCLRIPRRAKPGSPAAQRLRTPATAVEELPRPLESPLEPPLVGVLQERRRHEVGQAPVRKAATVRRHARLIPSGAGRARRELRRDNGPPERAQCPVDSLREAGVPCEKSTPRPGAAPRKRGQAALGVPVREGEMRVADWARRLQVREVLDH